MSLIRYQDLISMAVNCTRWFEYVVIVSMKTTVVEQNNRWGKVEMKRH